MYDEINGTTAVAAADTGTIIEARRVASDLDGVYYVEGAMRLIDGRRVRFEAYSARPEWGCATVGGHAIHPNEHMISVFTALEGVDIWQNEWPEAR